MKAAAADFQARSPDAALYAGGSPTLRALSPLAEGSDRMFAAEALSLGYSLCCPLPFAQAEYERDFAPPEALEAELGGPFS